MIMVLYFNHSLSDRFGLSRLKSLRNMMEMFEMKYNMYITCRCVVFLVCLV